MMNRIARTFGLGMLMVWPMSGCHNHDSHEMAMEEQECPECPEPSPYVSMADNALMHDSSISDIHFVPHTDELNGLGVERLDRLAKLLSPYGGTIHYQATATEPQLMEGRLSHVREYLTTTPWDTTRVQVVSGLSAGRGRRADEALEAWDEALQPKEGETMEMGLQSAMGGQ